jgi:hypothetical protein
MLRWGLLFVGSVILAGAETPRFEAGVQLSVMEMKGLGEKPVLAGGRVSARITRFVTADVEVNRQPIGGAISNFPATQVLMGARAGYRFGNLLGIYGKLRPGLVRFDRNRDAPGLGTRAAADIGGVVEFYSRLHILVRLDFGDTVVGYGSAPVQRPAGGVPAAIGMRHQFQESFGIGVWF